MDNQNEDVNNKHVEESPKQDASDSEVTGQGIEISETQVPSENINSIDYARIGAMFNRSAGDVTQHNEAYLRGMEERLGKTLSVVKRPLIDVDIDNYEKLLSILDGYGSEFATAYPRFSTFSKMLANGLKKSKVSFGSHCVGEVFDEDDPTILVEDVVETEELELDGTMAELLTHNYYSYEGEIIRQQKITVYKHKG